MNVPFDVRCAYAGNMPYDASRELLTLPNTAMDEARAIVAEWEQWRDAQLAQSAAEVAEDEALLREINLATLGL